MRGPMAILTDNPILGSDADEFGFREHAEVFCHAISQTSDLPLTVGVFGPWGSGKSSFLNICRDLLKEQGFVTVDFNPWKYDRRDEVWHALIQSLLDELIRRVEESPDPGLKDRLRQAVEKAWELRGVAAWLLARHFVPFAVGGLASADDVDNVRDAARQLSQQRAMKEELNYRHVNFFERDFADTVHRLTEERRLAVLIDDLDRCRGESALMALEALRLFIGDAPCVFVMAMDHQALIEAASIHFGDNEARGRNYLEKLINFPYYLPVARFESINRAFRSKLDFLAEEGTMWELIRANMGGNPRRIRRFINTFNLSVATLSRSSVPSRERQLQVAVLLMFRQEHPVFFDALQREAKAIAVGLAQPASELQTWTELEKAANSPGDTSLPGYLRQMADSDPSLLDAVASISVKRAGFAFPPPPSKDQILVLTEAMVLMPLTNAQPEHLPSPSSGAPLS